MLTKTVPFKEEISEGQRVADWREQTGRKTHGRQKRPGYHVGVVVGFQNPGHHEGHSSNILVRADTGRMVLVAPEQVRSAVGHELWSPTDEDIKAVLDSLRRLREGEGVLDHRGAPPEPHADRPEMIDLVPAIEPMPSLPSPLSGEPMIQEVPPPLADMEDLEEAIPPAAASSADRPKPSGRHVRWPRPSRTLPNRCG